MPPFGLPETLCLSGTRILAPPGCIAYLALRWDGAAWSFSSPGHDPSEWRPRDPGLWPLREE